MTEEDIRKTVVETGRRLISSNLTVRTWGNISMRIDKEKFAITPSGYSYENLQPSEIVILNIKKPDVFSGEIKPSSEKYIHAGIYALYPHVNFVIHTHQKFATALSILDNFIKIEDEKFKRILGSRIPISKYAAAGTKKIARRIINSLKTSDASCLLMANHGAIFFAKTEEEAFYYAQVLEEFSKQFIFQLLPALALAYTRFEKNSLLPRVNFYSSKKEGELCSVYDKNSGLLICKMDIKTGNVQEGDFDFPSDLHRKIYAEYPQINFIEQSVLPCAVYTSQKLKAEKCIPAFLDDFAQIIGDGIFCTDFFENKAEEFINSALICLKNKNAVLIAESGALCCVSNYADMFAAKEILEKNLLMKLLALKFKTYAPLPLRTARKLHKGYLTGYSKIAFRK